MERFKDEIKRRKLGVRLQELRSYYATLLRENGISKESIDLTQGRISKDVFTRFYYRPYLQQLKDRVLEAVQTLEDKLLVTGKTVDENMSISELSFNVLDPKRRDIRGFIAEIVVLWILWKEYRHSI